MKQNIGVGILTSVSVGGAVVRQGTHVRDVLLPKGQKQFQAKNLFASGVSCLRGRVTSPRRRGSVSVRNVKSKIYSLNCLSCFIHILNCKMSLFFGFVSFIFS